MASISTWSFGQDDLIACLNNGKDLLLGQLVVDGIITSEKCAQLSKEYVLVVLKPSTMGRIWDKLFKKPDDHKYALVKHLSIDGWENSESSDE